MKIRNGFVSNSSSSSFVVLLPKSFDVEKFVNESNILGSYAAGDILEGFELEEGEDEDSFVKEKTIEIINKFITDGCVYQDDYTDFNVIRNVLSDFIIADVDVSSDSGSGCLANTEQIEKILKS